MPENKYLCEGKEPFRANQNMNKDSARTANRQYYGLKGLTTKTHSPCPYCHRKSCKDRQACQAKKNKALASRSVMAERYESLRKEEKT